MACALNIDWEKKKEGEEGFREDIERLRDDLPSAIAAELSQIMEQVKQTAIEMCPCDSGALRSSISLTEGKISESSSAQGSEIYNCQIFAGNDETFNREGQSTSQYASAVHDGHMTKSGDFWEGTPFLTDALDAFESEIMACVSRAIDDMELGD